MNLCIELHVSSMMCHDSGYFCVRNFLCVKNLHRKKKNFCGMHAALIIHHSKNNGVEIILCNYFHCVHEPEKFDHDQIMVCCILCYLYH